MCPRFGWEEDKKKRKTVKRKHRVATPNKPQVTRKIIIDQKVKIKHINGKITESKCNKFLSYIIGCKTIFVSEGPANFKNTTSTSVQQEFHIDRKAAKSVVKIYRITNYVK